MSTQHQIDVTCNENLSVFAERNKIGQVFNNLGSNAIEYCPAGGTVRVRAELQESRVLAEVSEEGTGISMKDQKQLFQRFFSVENDELAAGTGFGTGLYIVAETLGIMIPLLRWKDGKEPRVLSGSIRILKNKTEHIFGETFMVLKIFQIQTRTPPMYIKTVFCVFLSRSAYQRFDIPILLRLKKNRERSSLSKI